MLKRITQFVLVASVLSLSVAIFAPESSKKLFAQQNPQGLSCGLYTNGSSFSCLPSAVVNAGSGASGTNGALTTGTCATVSAAMTGVTTSSTVTWSFASSPVGIAGYGSGGTLASPDLTVTSYPTNGSGNLQICNDGSGSVTPGAATVNVNLKALP